MRSVKQQHGREPECSTLPSEASSEAVREPPKSLLIARKGIYTAQDFCNVMSALMVDLLEGRVTDRIGNATVNAGGKMLKAAELMQKYGVDGEDQKKRLVLAERSALDKGHE